MRRRWTTADHSFALAWLLCPEVYLVRVVGLSPWWWVPDAYMRTVTALNLRPTMVFNPDVGSRGAKKHPTLSLTPAPSVGGACVAMPVGANTAGT